MDYDDELRRHNEVLRRAYGVQPRERVLDIGCGSGQTTREVARMAPAGGALGVDISVPAIERARELAEAQGVRNVTFERADFGIQLFSAFQKSLSFATFSSDTVPAPDRRAVRTEQFEVAGRGELHMVVHELLPGASRARLPEDGSG